MTDTDLRTRLAALDPASDLPPLPGDDRTALLARAAVDGRRIPRPARPRLRIAAAGLVTVLAVIGVVTWGASRPVYRAGVLPLRPIALSVPDATLAQCLPVADLASRALPSSDLALAGTVDATRSGSVVIAIDRLYRGGPATQVVLNLPEQGAEDFTRFEAGEHVLIAAQDGAVIGCGLSGEASPELQAFYDAAF